MYSEVLLEKYGCRQEYGRLVARNEYAYLCSISGLSFEVLIVVYVICLYALEMNFSKLSNILSILIFQKRSD